MTRRVEELNKLDLAHVYSDEFLGVPAEEILSPAPPGTSTARPAPKKIACEYIRSLYAVPLLTKPQEQHLFRQYNFLKWRAHETLLSLGAGRPSQKKLRSVEDDHRAAMDVRDGIITANLRLVVSIASKKADGTNLYDLISDGNVTLMRAVEKFDYTRGFKFSTYAATAIIRCLYYKRNKDTIYSEMHIPLTPLVEAIAEDESAAEHRALARQKTMECEVDKLLSFLDEREIRVMKSRHGIGYLEHKTLQDVGNDEGVSKERIRQIQLRAEDKIRDLVDIGLLKEVLQWEE